MLRSEIHTNRVAHPIFVFRTLQWAFRNARPANLPKFRFTQQERHITSRAESNEIDSCIKKYLDVNDLLRTPVAKDSLETVVGHKTRFAMDGVEQALFGFAKLPDGDKEMNRVLVYSSSGEQQRSGREEQNMETRQEGPRRNGIGLLCVLFFGAVCFMAGHSTSRETILLVPTDEMSKIYDGVPELESKIDAFGNSVWTTTRRASSITFQVSESPKMPKEEHKLPW